MSQADSSGVTQALPVVTQVMLVEAFQAVGVRSGDTALFHSSLKSFGQVEGGAETVIAAAEEAVGTEGTVVFPTLVQRDFAQAYQRWDVMKTPSDVGWITEVFRQQAGTLRSDQATHSVAARGRLAEWLTADHTAYGPRMGVFGDYAFSWSSPWQRMYQIGARVLLLGVGFDTNTFLHLGEYWLIERQLEAISDPVRRCAAMAPLARFGVPGIWAWQQWQRTEQFLSERGLLRETFCGQARIRSFQANAYIDALTADMECSPENWFNPEFTAWMRQYGRNRRTGTHSI